MIRKLNWEDPLWGAPRIHGELLKLGIEIGEIGVGKHMDRHRKPAPQTRRTFPDNHLKRMVSVDFFTVPAIRFQILCVFLALAQDGRLALQRCALDTGRYSISVGCVLFVSKLQSDRDGWKIEGTIAAARTARRQESRRKLGTDWPANLTTIGRRSSNCLAIPALR